MPYNPALRSMIIESAKRREKKAIEEAHAPLSAKAELGFRMRDELHAKKTKKLEKILNGKG